MQVSGGLRRRWRGGACSEGSQAIRLAILAEVTPSMLWLDLSLSTPGDSPRDPQGSGPEVQPR